MSIDPSDDCTFWYTTEYIPVNGSFNWKTRIASFKFPGCGTVVVNDFSISANPSSLTLAQGATGTSTISTAVVSGSPETISLTVTGAPSGATATLNPTSVTTGGSSTLTVKAGSAAVGTYTLTIKGTAPSATHSTTVTLKVTSRGTVIVNGGFETGDLTGWAHEGTTAVISPGHTGSFAARLGSTTATNGSVIAQTFTVPAAGGTLSFYYNVHCPDTVNNDWATATIKNGNVITTVLPKTCTNTNTWVNQSFSLASYAGKSVTLYLINKDDNVPANPTYTLFDDVVVQ
jgi:hypothetical protein